MVFNSFEFALFLPAVFAVYWVLGKHLRLQNVFVVAASYVFYGLWSWKFLVLIAFTSLCSYAAGIAIEHERGRGNKSRAKGLCIANAVVNLAILGIFKYYDFFVGNFVELLAMSGINIETTTLQLVLPVGISFYTFQALSYSIDVYRRDIPATRNVVAFFAYISFFPQLVAGPIERATNLLPQFLERRTFDYNRAVDGMRQILWGLFKKVVIADNCAGYVNTVFNDYPHHSGSSLLIAGVLFAFQIYGDFSGYSDIAIGTGKMFGIRLRDNFRMPYFSRDVAEFWKRWHISLNRWFVDYVYIPLGGSRKGKFKTARNVFVIFLLSGLWHGANWTYVTWGLYHAVLFLPLITLGLNKRNTGTASGGRLLPSCSDLVKMTATFILVVMGWIIFRADNITVAGHIFAKIFSSSILDMPYDWAVAPCYRIPTLVAIAMCLVTEWLNREGKHGLDLDRVASAWVRIPVYYLVVAMIVLYSGENVTFIYFQF